MKLSEIIEILEKEFPKELAFSWDNVGLSLGKGDNEIKKVLLTLDVYWSIWSFAFESNT